MINKTLITLVILFVITGCGSSQGQSTVQKYHAQCSVGNMMTDEIVTNVDAFGTYARYDNVDGKKVLYASNCKITQL